MKVSMDTFKKNFVEGVARLRLMEKNFLEEAKRRLFGQNVVVVQILWRIKKESIVDCVLIKRSTYMENL